MLNYFKLKKISYRITNKKSTLPRISFKWRRNFLQIQIPEFKEVTLEKIPFDIDLLKLWRFLNPEFELQIVKKFMIGLFINILSLNLLESGGTFDPQQELNVYNVIFGILFLILSFYCFISLLTPLFEYHKLRKRIITKSLKIIDQLYENTDHQSLTTFQLNEKLYLREYLTRHENSPILPFKKPVLSLLFIVPIIGQILALVLRFVK